MKFAGTVSVPETCGCLRSDLELTRHPLESRVLVRDPLTNKIYAFSENAFAVLENLNPQLAVRENIVRSLGREPAPELLAGMVSLIEQAQSAGLLSHDGSPGLSASKEWNRHKRRLPNPFFIVIPLVNPQRFLAALRPIALPLFSRIALALWMFFMAATIAMVAARGEAYRADFALFRTTRSWGMVYVLLFLATVVHEFGHAFACERFGFHVKKLGVLIYLFNPGAYVDITGAWLLPKRTQRISVSLGGVYLESYIWMGSAWVWLSGIWLGAKPGNAIQDGAFILSVVLSFRIFINLLPFFRLDGYWVLTDLVGISNLRSKSFHYVLSFLPAIGRCWTPRQKADSVRAMILASYGLASMALMIYAVIAATSKIHRWLLYLSPVHGGIYFALACAAVIVLGILKLLQELNSKAFRV